MPRHVGSSPLRREDKKLITGQGIYVADVALDNPLHISFVRSPVASGTLVDCDLSEALEQPGVVAGFCGKDVAQLGSLSVNPILGNVDASIYPILAHGQVLAVGQPVAAVLSTSPIAGMDAAEHIQFNIEDQDSLPVQRMAFQKQWQQGETDKAFDSAAHVIKVAVYHPRLAPSPMENRAIVVRYDAEKQGVTVWLSSQTPHRARQELSDILGIALGQVNVIAPDVGGAFGLKASLYPEEVFAVWAAFKLCRSMRWISTRNEDLMSATHGRGITTTGKLAISATGKFLGLRAEIQAPVGAWLSTSAAIPAWNAARILPGPYDIAALDLSTCGVHSNTAPVGIYRGAGRPEAAMLMERLVDEAARTLSVDPVQLRKQNLLAADQLPHARATGVLLDSGDYAAALDLLCQTCGYAGLEKLRDERRRSGEIVGLGIGLFLEPSGTGWESAKVRLNADNTIDVFSGGSSQGHGRETAYAQIVADVFGCELRDISIHHSNTESCPPGIGALASRSTAIGGSAVLQAARQVAQKAQACENWTTPLEATVSYESDGEAWGYGCYLAQVVIDPDTGKLTIEKLTCVDDAGVVINPMMVEGQIWGGLAQGIGEATMESLVYDNDGQLITGSLMDYCLPRASDMPPVEFAAMATASPANLLGAKGVGEAGTIGAPVALMNAALDALRPLGVRDLSMPLTSAKIWQAIQQAKSTNAK